MLSSLRRTPGGLTVSSFRQVAHTKDKTSGSASSRQSLRAPVPSHDLCLELDSLAAVTEFRGLQVFDFLADECLQTMSEIGRLREKVFRSAGAGRGESVDVDALDFGAHAYRQLVVFDPISQELVAMLRYQRGSRVDSEGDAVLRTSTLFDYSLVFRRDILPQGVELGRSVVNLEARRARVGLFALWRGLAVLATGADPFQYFFGNVSIYSDFNPSARDLMVATVEHLYAPPEPMFIAKPHLRLAPTVSPVLSTASWSLAREGVAHVQEVLAPYGARMPSILQSYLSLSTEIWCGETARDADFGSAHEMAIIVPLLRLEKRARSLFGLDR